MNYSTAQLIMRKVAEDYNTIAEHFSQTRQKEWYEFFNFSPYINSGDKILDLGCGNGRLLQYLANYNIEYTGIDISEKLIKIASNLAQNKKNKLNYFPYFSFIYGNLTNLPIANNSFDLVFALASLYHIPSQELRKKAFQEIERVLKESGILILSYWNMWHYSRIKYVFKNILKKIIQKSKYDYLDGEKSWKNSQGRIMVNRYYHAFTLKEINNLLKNSNLSIIDKFYSKKNKRAHFWNGFNGIVIVKKSLTFN